MEAPSSPLLTFGIVTDVQYAERPARIVEGRVREYTTAPAKLHRAIDAFLADRPKWVVNLGDIIDGHHDNEEQTAADLEVVLCEFRRLEGAVPLHHVVGNHCVLMPLPRLQAALGLGGGTYYTLREAGWRFVVLDGVEINVQRGTRAEALAWLDAHKDEPHAVGWNGGLSDGQFAWLQAQLAEATAAGERVLIFCHMPVLKEASDYRHILYDYERVLALLRATPAVVAWIAGHFHPGGYARDGHVHHVTLQAVLEAPSDSTAYGYIDVYPDRARLRGYGAMRSYDLDAVLP